MNTCPVTITAGSKTSAGEVSILTWTKRERTARAVKSLAGVWALAAFSILVPVLHFFLVPGFLLAGPLLATFLYRQHSTVSGGNGTCPACGKPFEIVKARDEWPLRDICNACHEHVRIEKA